MLYRRSSAAAIQHHLQGIEYELRRLGRNAGRQTSSRASVLREQIAGMVIPLLNEVAHLLRSSPRLVANEAARFGEDTAKAGVRLGNKAFDRIASEVEHRPLIILAVVLGAGILIGLAGRHRLGN